MKPKAKLVINKSINIEKFILISFLIILSVGIATDLRKQSKDFDSTDFVFFSIIIPSLLFLIFILPDIILLYWDKITFEISSENYLYVIYNKQVIFKCELDIIDSFWIESSSVNFLPTGSQIFVYLKEEDSLLGSKCLMLNLSSIFSINKIRKIEAYTIYNFLVEHNDKIRFTIY